MPFGEASLPKGLTGLEEGDGLVNTRPVCSATTRVTLSGGVMNAGPGSIPYEKATIEKAEPMR
jgi:hypothetical protein